MRSAKLEPNSESVMKAIAEIRKSPEGKLATIESSVKPEKGKRNSSMQRKKEMLATLKQSKFSFGDVFV